MNATTRRLSRGVLPKGYDLTASFIDWIWHVRGSLPLASGQTGDDAFDRLDPLFHQYGTRHDRAGDTVTFHKKDQAAQDKMSIFDHGVLWIEQRGTGAILRYDLTSRALLFCFLAPLLFLAVAQLTVFINTLQKPQADAAKKPDKKEMVLPQHPIDKALGAPAPEKPKDKKDDKAKEDDEKLSPTASYVFAGIFATLYLVGRVLEDRLIKGLFRRKLRGM
jgi:hypothetical protein